MCSHDSYVNRLTVFFNPNPGFKQFGKFPLKIMNRLLQNRVKFSAVLIVKDREILPT